MRSILLALLLSSVAHAGPAEVAASLSGEQAECRYLLDICRQAAKAEGTKALSLMADAGAAAQVIRAKHDAMPSCFRKCTRADGKPMLNLERFR